MGQTYDKMHAFAAYGHLILRPDVEEAEKQLLAAAYADGRLVQADTDAFFNDDNEPEGPSPWESSGSTWLNSVRTPATATSWPRTTPEHPAPTRSAAWNYRQNRHENHSSGR
ncbi:hypothetical protein [Actinoplanes sp. NPDC020271]|uniref:hypothetical protein n=1 Tax=Actinoplanes sp. NPDC020271 TaxID=3363896 RepID=UPI003796AB0D